MRSSAEASRKKPAKEGKRFNLDLSAEAYQDMEELAEMIGGRTKVEVFRVALSLLKTVYPAILAGEELCLVNRKAKTETKIVIPR
jgi:hypothetical protein